MHWQSIGILGKPHAAEQSLQIFQILYELLSEWNYPVFFEQQVGMLLHAPKSQCLATQALIQHCALILVVGGDGSMLNAARYAVQFQKSLIGINRGRLGFLTDISPEELSTRLRNVLNGEYWREQRTLLEGTIVKQDSAPTQYHALNDIVLSLGASAHLIEFELWVDQTFVCRQRADGLIITTPTGSTAYALSAGGPILHPQLNAIAIIPMLPHKLSSRPIVINDRAEITIILTSQQTEPARLSFDSHKLCSLHTHDVVKIKQLVQKLDLIHPIDYNYYQTLRDKLHWENE